MTNILEDEAGHGDNAVPFLLQTRIRVTPVVDKLAATGDGSEEMPTGIAAGSVLDEWAVGSACYMCHACTNFGVQGAAEGRPCSKGLSNLIMRRSRARKSSQVARRAGI